MPDNDYSHENYGYKTQNLGKLKKICGKLSDGGIQVEVPFFEGITHAKIDAFLMKNGLNVTEEWQQIIQKMGAPTNLDLVIDDLENLRQRIQTLFENNANQLDLGEFLGQLNAEQDLLMVRSTGKEDTAQFSNAGGNESVSAVKPSIESIGKAIGKVIASYFSEKSLQQRLLANNNISDPPFMPVLLQKMVGETKDNIVSSGVMYIRANHTFIQAAPGHCELVVDSLGRVDNFWITPSGIIDHDLTAKPFRLVPNPDLESPERLLQVKNAAELRDRPSLQEETVRNLAVLAKEIETQYDDAAMDMEFVYSPTENKIYVVQARPLGKNEELESTLVEPMALSAATIKTVEQTHDWLNGQAIAPPGDTQALAYLRTITAPDEILIMETMNLNRCLEACKGERLRLKVLVLKSDIGLIATSHAAAVLNSLKIPIMIMSNPEHFSQLQAWINKPLEHLPLVFDRQRAGFVKATKLLSASQVESFKQLDVDEQRRDFLLEAGIAQPGLVRSAVSPTTTAMPPKFNPTIVPADIITLTSERSNLTWEQLIKQSNSSNPEEAKKALSELYSRLFIELDLENPKLIFIRSGSALKDCFETLNNATVATAEAISNARIALALLTKWALRFAQKNSSSENNRIFQQIVFLAAAYLDELDKVATKSAENKSFLLDLSVKIEGLILYIGNDIRHHTSFSYGWAQKKYQTKLIANAKKKLSGDAISFTKARLIHYDRYALTPKIKANWQALIAAIDKPSDEEFLLGLCRQLEKVGVLEFFFNNTVATLLEKTEFSEAKFPLISKKASELLTNIKALHLDDYEETLLLLQEKINDWGSRDNFDKLSKTLNDFEKLADRLFTMKSEDLCVRYRLNSLRVKLINIFDESVKAFKASPDYSKDPAEQVARFKIMLQTYHKIMQASFILVSKEDMVKWGRTRFDKTQTTTSISTKFSEMLEQENSSEQLFNSAFFSVDNQCINSSSQVIEFSSANACNAKTAEDFFTLFHQNALACTQTQNAPAIPDNELYVDSAIVKIVRTFEAIAESSKKMPSLYNFKLVTLHSESDYPLIKYYFNIPVRTHSGKIELIFNREDNSLKVNFMTFGKNEKLRFNHLAGMALIDGYGLNASKKQAVVLSPESMLDVDPRSIHSSGEFWRYWKGSIEMISTQVNIEWDLDIDKTASLLQQNPHFFDRTFSGYHRMITDQEWGGFKGGLVQTLEKYCNSIEPLTMRILEEVACGNKLFRAEFWYQALFDDNFSFTSFKTEKNAFRGCLQFMDILYAQIENKSRYANEAKFILDSISFNTALEFFTRYAQDKINQRGINAISYGEQDIAEIILYFNTYSPGNHYIKNIVELIDIAINEGFGRNKIKTQLTTNKELIKEMRLRFSDEQINSCFTFPDITEILINIQVDGLLAAGHKLTTDQLEAFNTAFFSSRLLNPDDDAYTNMNKLSPAERNIYLTILPIENEALKKYITASINETHSDTTDPHFLILLTACNAQYSLCKQLLAKIDFDFFAHETSPLFAQFVATLKKALNDPEHLLHTEFTALFNKQLTKFTKNPQQATRMLNLLNKEEKTAVLSTLKNMTPVDAGELVSTLVFQGEPDAALQVCNIQSAETGLASDNILLLVILTRFTPILELYDFGPKDEPLKYAYIHDIKSVISQLATNTSIKNGDIDLDYMGQILDYYATKFSSMKLQYSVNIQQMNAAIKPLVEKYDGYQSNNKFGF